MSDDLHPGASHETELDNHCRIVFVGDGKQTAIQTLKPINKIIKWSTEPPGYILDVMVWSPQEPTAIQFNFAPAFGQRVTIDYLPTS